MAVVHLILLPKVKIISEQRSILPTLLSYCEENHAEFLAIKSHLVFEAMDQTIFAIVVAPYGVVVSAPY